MTHFSGHQINCTNFSETGYRGSTSEFPFIIIPSELRYTEVDLKLQPIKSAFRMHAVVVVNNFILLHGGRVFNRMRNDVIGDKEISIYDSSSSRWFSAKING